MAWSLRGFLSLALASCVGCATQPRHAPLVEIRDPVVRDAASATIASPAPDPSPAASVDVGSDGDVSVTAEPPNPNKRERERIALLGLRFEETVTLDPQIAPQIAQPGPIEDSLMHVSRGEELLKGNQPTSALEAFKYAILIAPDDSRGYEALGRGLMVKGKGKMAVAALRTAVELDPEFFDAQVNLARALDQYGDRPGAIAAFEDVLGVAPDYGFAHHRLAVLHYYESDDDLAWENVHAAEALGEQVPPQFRVLLAQRTPEPPQ